MDRAIWGFAAGVALTAAGFFAFREGAPSATRTAGDAPREATLGKASSDTRPAPNWGSSPFSENAGSAANPSDDASFATAAMAKIDKTPEATASPTPAKSAAGAATPASPDAGWPGKPVDEDASSQEPQFLSGEYSRAIAEDRAHPRSPSQWHDDFSQQSRDPAWAPTAERQLQNYFGDLAARGIVLHGMQCRETMCEMKFTEPLGVPSQFQGSLNRWYATGRGFGGTLWNAAEGTDGQRYIVLLVRRWPQKS